MFAIVLNPIIAKKSMKENWKIKGIIIYQDYRTLQIIANEKEITEIKEIIKMENSNQSYK